MMFKNYPKCKLIFTFNSIPSIFKRVGDLRSISMLLLIHNVEVLWIQELLWNQKPFSVCKILMQWNIVWRKWRVFVRMTNSSSNENFTQQVSLEKVLCNKMGQMLIFLAFSIHREAQILEFCLEIDSRDIESYFEGFWKIILLTRSPTIEHRSLCNKKRYFNSVPDLGSFPTEMNAENSKLFSGKT